MIRVLLFSLLFSAFPLFAKSTDPVLGGMDLFGSTRVKIEDVRSAFGEQMDRCVQLLIKVELDNHTKCVADFNAKVKERFDFAYVNLSGIRYLHLDPNPIYFTVDVVEKVDAPIRLDFLPEPTAEINSVDELLHKWDEYMTLGWALVRKGELTAARDDCKAYHCIFGHKHPELAPYESIFLNGVRDHRKEIEQVLLSDRRASMRASAAFVLAYGEDPVALVNVLKQRIRDPDDGVRNNVVRVFSDLAAYHPNVELPVEDVIPLLNFPDTTDRNKALAMLHGVAKHQAARYRKLLVKQTVPQLLAILRLLQLNNHDWAYAILRELSGEVFGDRDYESWEKWYQSQISH